MALVLAVVPTLVAAQNPCYYSCLGLNVQSVIKFSRLRHGNAVSVDYTTPPSWWDSGWVSNHLAPAGSAWGVGTAMAFSISPNDPDVRVVFVTSETEWTQTLGLASNVVMAGQGAGAPYTYWPLAKLVYVNVAFLGDSFWHEEPGYPSGYERDVQTALIHELGHTMGYGDTYEGYEACGVMTPVYSGVERSIGALDINATQCYYAPIPVGDIQSFEVSGFFHNVLLDFTIEGGTDPAQYAAVYVSDNSLGPARLVGALTGHALLVPSTNRWTDDMRLPPTDYYYYWLDYDYGPFAERRSPHGLYAAADVPVQVVVGGSRVVYDAPDILAVTDVPLDRGAELAVSWAASGNETEIDYYNIYRNTYPDGHPEEGEWKYFGSVNPGVHSYVGPAIPEWVTQYRVSAAHHGTYALEPGDGNLGIWNDMSSVVSGTAIDNFALGQITLVSNDTLRVCPAGHDGTLEVEVIIRGSDLSPTAGIPPEMLACYGQADSVHFCDALIVDGPTDATGRTTLTASRIGGHGRADLIFGLADSFTRFDTLTVYFKSPDENGDGNVTVVDFSYWFTSTYQSPPHTYKWYRDFWIPPDGKQTLPDFGFFGQHYNHVCSAGGGSQAPATTEALPNAGVRVDLREVISATDARTLQADISITNAEPFSGAYIALRSDHPALKFARWEKGSYPGRVLVAPVVRDGVSEIAIGVLDGQKLASRNLALGRLVYDVTTDGSLELRSQDFEKRAADMALVTGTIGTMGSAATSGAPSIQRVVENALAQNHPNPFNPTTTISYSIARPGRVSLAIFSVNGALVRRLVDEDQTSDSYRVTWDGTDGSGQPVASGIYFYRLVTGSFVATRKMVLLK